MTETSSGSGQYSRSLIVPNDLSLQGEHSLNVEWQCSGQPQSENIGQLTIWLYDPSGQITDATTGLPVEGATVTLQRVPGAFPDTATETKHCRTVNTRNGNDWSNEPAAEYDAGVFVNPDLFTLNGTQEISPTVNPHITGVEGRYAWDVIEGCWYVIVEASGYQAKVSPIVGVPAAVTDLDITLTKSNSIYLPIILKD